MKILHIISQTPDFTGSGKFIQQILLQAGKKGHENFLVAGAQGDFVLPKNVMPGERVQLVRFDNRDLPFSVAGMSDAMPYDSTVFSCMTEPQLTAYKTAFQGKISQALEQFQPDLIHSHHLWIVSALAREVAPSLPMVTTCHGTCLRQHRFCTGISHYISPSLEKIDQVMALSKSQQQEIMDGFGFSRNQVPIMAGGYDETIFKPLPKPDSGVVEIVYAGKLCRAKGVPWLIKSLEKIKDIPFRLHLAGGGSGEEKQTCLDLASRLGSQAVYHGPLSHEDLATLMGRCHLFVLPSFFEGVPLVLMEALACGCRVLSTDLPGAKEILSPADGSHISFFDLPPLKTIDSPHEKDEPMLEENLADQLKQVMGKILRDPEIDKSLMEKRTQAYTWDKVFDRIDSVYQSVTN